MQDSNRIVLYRNMGSIFPFLKLGNYRFIHENFDFYIEMPNF